MSLDVLSLVLAPLGLGTIPPTADAVASPGPFLEGRHVDRLGLRDYRLYVPLSHAACAGRDGRGSAAAAALSPLPLVVMLHGCTQTPEDFARGTRMNEAAEALGFLVLYPGQCPRANPSRCWNWFSPAERRRDAGEAGLLATMVRDVMARHPVDPSRVYVAGLSAGGAMAAVMGAAYPDLFAAVGVHSGPVPGAASDLSSALALMRDGPAATRDDPLAMPPVIVFHGDRDDTVHPANGAHLVGARDDDCGCGCGDGRGCAGGASRGAGASAGRAPVAGSARSYTRRTLRDDAGRVRAEHWSVHGSGHAWSGGSASGSYTDPEGPSATDAMLRFFFAHPLHGATPRRPRLPWLRPPRRAGGGAAGAAQKPGTRSPSIFARAKT